MSRKHRERENKGIFGGKRPSLPTLIILILILLQFSNRDFDDHKDFGGIDNGILFIIALFYLSCCNPCKDGGRPY
ncbi:hypothetical protein [Candidatus Clostridium radicumherbarum]|uniref:Uncharacterized protein n=1 Tax=Candidatus Clostridium radicumherbarum TaxID=3381662 RepID=A0ABW8TXB4_9CLOT